MKEKQQLVAAGRAERLLEPLRGLLAEPGMLGAAVVTRDGLRVADLWARETWNKETLSAMSATMISAAEVALADVGTGRTRSVVAEASQTRLAVVGVTPELLLTVLAGVALPTERLLRLAHAAAARIAELASA